MPSKAKNSFILTLFVLILAFPLSGTTAPHLLLYFDVNKTVIATDKAANRSMEEILNSLLAEKYQALWDESLTAPISFYDYVNRVLVPGPLGDPQLRNQRRQFIDHFVDEMRKRSHPLYEEVLKEYQAAKTVLKMTHGAVFPSFYRLIDHLDAEEISYSIVLRSMGNEIGEVTNEIDVFYGNFFAISGKFRAGILFLGEDLSLHDPSAIYTKLRRTAHAAIHDDWHFWSANHLAATHGKPFYIDQDDLETLPIFFDDNIWEDSSDKNIVAPLDAKSGKLLPVEPLVRSGQLVRVDTLEAILDRDYFLKHVQKVIKKEMIEGKKGVTPSLYQEFLK